MHNVSILFVLQREAQKEGAKKEDGKSMERRASVIVRMLSQVEERASSNRVAEAPAEFLPIPCPPEPNELDKPVTSPRPEASGQEVRLFPFVSLSLVADTIDFFSVRDVLLHLKVLEKVHFCNPLSVPDRFTLWRSRRLATLFIDATCRRSRATSDLLLLVPDSM